MALIPLLALAGAFGERRQPIRSERGGLLLRGLIPSRLRYRQHMTLDISVTNRGPLETRAVSLRADTAYLNRFSNVSISPAIQPDGAIPLGDLPPGASGRATISLEADRVGVAHGALTVTTAAADSVSVSFQTLTFP